VNIDLRTIARVLGGDVSGKQALVPGPGHSRQDRSLSICLAADAPDGFVVHSFAGDDAFVCKDYIRERLGLPQWQPGDGQDRRLSPSRLRQFDQTALGREGGKRPHTEDDAVRIERAVRIWEEAQDPRGSLAQTYLKIHRKLELDDELASDVLRFHPACPWRNENTGKTDRVPALIAAFRSIDSGTITAIHRIALNRDGTKLDRRMFGVVYRAAVMLDPIGPDLAIGEGIETCMAARQLGIRPAWALGSVGNISGFPIIDGIKRLTVLGEVGQASADAIQFCGRRWCRAGRRVRVITPTMGNDLNDELMAAAS
jgi:Toprim domain-containing protein